MNNDFKVGDLVSHFHWPDSRGIILNLEDKLRGEGLYVEILWINDVARQNFYLIGRKHNIVKVIAKEAKGNPK